jgi:hypothetical protein
VAHLQKEWYWIIALVLFFLERDVLTDTLLLILGIIYKTYHELDTSEVIKALAIIREEPHFKQFIEFREAQREEVIRHLGAETETNRHFLLTGKLEAIDQELDMIKTLS